MTMSMSSPRPIASLRRWLDQNALTIAVLVLLVLLWEAIARNVDNNNVVASVPYTTRQLFEQSATITTQVGTTYSHVTMAFILATIFGVIMGILIAEIFVIRQMTMPILIFLYAIPHAVIAPLFVIWFTSDTITLFGFSHKIATSVVVFGAWVAFFPVFISTITGMAQLEERYDHLGSVIGATRFQMLRYFKFWSALPNIASSIKAAVQLSIVGVIVAEFLASGGGIGWQLVTASQRGNLGYFYAVVIVIMVVSYVFYKIIVKILEWVTPPGAIN